MSDGKCHLNEYIVESAARYLQTVVLVDDHAYQNGSTNVPSDVNVPGQVDRKRAVSSDDATPGLQEGTGKTAEDPEKREEASFQKVQHGFAKRSIICSLYQPEENASFGDGSEVHQICSAADVVVVDWSFYGDAGERANELIGNLVQQSRNEAPHQMKLLLIYTLADDVEKVAREVCANLKSRIGEESVKYEEKGTGLTITTNNARIVVLSKREDRFSQYSALFVPEGELVERTIAEFSCLASGLLQSIVLRGLAFLRKNDLRILTRFHSDLDAAFLTHRALLLPDESFRQIIPLLTDELRAVLEDTLGDCPLGDASEVSRIIEDWCATRWEPGDLNKDTCAGAVPSEFANDFFKSGHEYSKWSDNWKRDTKKAEMAKLLSTDSKGVPRPELLSVVMSQRVCYENASRALHLGVILRELEGDRRYMLCLQPVCDSVRINGKTARFIFCFLDAASPDKPLTHTLVDLNDNPIDLTYNPRTGNCCVVGFTVESSTLCAAKNGDGCFVYEADDKTKYEWIAELKTEHAQRAAEEFGRVLSRVGLTESEWLRLSAKKK